jgi:hypothetical protein
MKLLLQRRSASTYGALIILITALVGYAIETAEADHTDSGNGAVISEDQKPTFLAYAKRRNMQPSLSIDRVAIGDQLPDVGITYYVLPLSYGHPFYRYASVGANIVIVDRFSGVVVQVLN